ncbi:MAG: glucose 1-dehydrogenase [Actinomycetota bacterium]|nr:glucose 1-dehydrogenase [Actinomycetota bacterium]
MSGRLEGKVALITGAARGQGEAEARRFVAEGAKVLLTDLLDDDGEAAAKALGDAAAYQHLDVTSEDEWNAAVATAEERFGPLSTLVNNAGILDMAPIHEQDIDRFRKVLDINLVGTVIGMKVAAASMRKAGGGSIINIASNAGMVGLPQAAAYVSSKWAVRGVSKTAAIDLGPFGIRVNSVHPGGIATPMTGGGNELSGWVKKLPIPRWGQPDDVANVVTFLASDEAAYVTGVEWSVDGGATSGDRGIFE